MPTGLQMETRSVPPSPQALLQSLLESSTRNDAHQINSAAIHASLINIESLHKNLLDLKLTQGTDGSEDDACLSLLNLGRAQIHFCNLTYLTSLQAGCKEMTDFSHKFAARQQHRSVDQVRMLSVLRQQRTDLYAECKRYKDAVKALNLQIKDAQIAVQSNLKSLQGVQVEGDSSRFLDEQKCLLHSARRQQQQLTMQMQQSIAAEAGLYAREVEMSANLANLPSEKVQEYMQAAYKSRFLEWEKADAQSAMISDLKQAWNHADKCMALCQQQQQVLSNKLLRLKTPSSRLTQENQLQLQVVQYRMHSMQRIKQITPAMLLQYASSPASAQQLLRALAQDTLEQQVLVPSIKHLAASLHQELSPTLFGTDWLWKPKVLRNVSTAAKIGVKIPQPNTATQKNALSPLPTPSTTPSRTSMSSSAGRGSVTPASGKPSPASVSMHARRSAASTATPQLPNRDMNAVGMDMFVPMPTEPSFTTMSVSGSEAVHRFFDRMPAANMQLDMSTNMAPGSPVHDVRGVTAANTGHDQPVGRAASGFVTDQDVTFMAMPSALFQGFKPAALPNNGAYATVNLGNSAGVTCADLNSSKQASGSGINRFMGSMPGAAHVTAAGMSRSNSDESCSTMNTSTTSFHSEIEESPVQSDSDIKASKRSNAAGQARERPPGGTMGRAGNVSKQQVAQHAQHAMLSAARTHAAKAEGNVSNGTAPVYKYHDRRQGPNNANAHKNDNDEKSVAKRALRWFADIFNAGLYVPQVKYKSYDFRGMYVGDAVSTNAANSKKAKKHSTAGRKPVREQKIRPVQPPNTVPALARYTPPRSAHKASGAGAGTDISRPTSGSLDDSTQMSSYAASTIDTVITQSTDMDTADNTSLKRLVHAGAKLERFESGSGDIGMDQTRGNARVFTPSTTGGNRNAHAYNTHASGVNGKIDTGPLQARLAAAGRGHKNSSLQYGKVRDVATSPAEASRGQSDNAGFMMRLKNKVARLSCMAA